MFLKPFLHHPCVHSQLWPQISTEFTSQQIITDIINALTMIMEIFKCNSFALLAPTAMAYAPLWALPPTLETTTIPSKTKDLNDKNKCLHILQFILFLFIYLLLLVAFDA